MEMGGLERRISLEKPVLEDLFLPMLLPPIKFNEASVGLFRGLNFFLIWGTVTVLCIYGLCSKVAGKVATSPF
jgi:hypothetical protein